MSHSGSFEIRRKSTHEQLRSSHIETLYTLEKTLSENESLRLQLQALQEKFDKLLADVQLAKPTEVIISDLHNENSNLHTTLTEYSKKIAEYEISMKTINTSKAVLEKKFNSKVTEMTYAHENALKHQRIQHTIRYNMLGEDYTALLIRLADKEASLERNKALSNKMSEAQIELLHVQEQLATSRAELTSLSATHNALQLEITQLRQTQSKNAQDYEANEQQLLRRISVLESDLMQSVNESTHLQQRICDLQDQPGPPQNSFFATAIDTQLFHSSSASCLPHSPETRQKVPEPLPTLPPSSQDAVLDALPTAERFTFEEFITMKRENQTLKLQLAALSDTMKKVPVSSGRGRHSSKHIQRATSANDRR